MIERAPASLKASRIGETLIITVLVESIHNGNAHWVKEEILGYLKYLEDRHLDGVIINLNNVKHIGHVGLGAMIAVNSQMRKFKTRALMGLQKEVADLVYHSHMEKVFALWTHDLPCPICHQQGCEHIPQLVKKETEFLAKDYPVDEKAQPSQSEKVTYLYGMPFSASNITGPMADQFFEKAQEKEQSQRRLLVSMGIGLGVLLLTSGLSLGYIAATQNQPRPYNVPDAAEALDKYDKDGDGKLTPIDGKALTFDESTHLMHTPWCKPLGIPCVESKKGQSTESAH